jgi:anthocyanidin 3-O-glucoside 5-O-glucosyltransferase
MGVEVTFSTSQSAIHRITKSNTDPSQLGLTFSPFFDGYEYGLQPGVDMGQYIADVKTHGSQHIRDVIDTGLNQGNPFTHLVYTTLASWAGQVAHSLSVPCTLLWLQTATILDIYYYNFNGYGDIIRKTYDDPKYSVKLPGLPSITSIDLPSHLVSSNTNNFGLPIFEDHIAIIAEETNPSILVNTVDNLEFGFLRSIEKLNMKAIGPLIPSDTPDKSYGGDLFESSRDYTKFLDSKPESSVIYISFGSISVLSDKQNQEIGQALVEIGRPFLWVIKEESNEFSISDELRTLGTIVPWCSQVKVLSHKSVGCFVTHCGWNSTLESLTCGVPMVAFPQWTDQMTNAKLIEDVWKTGVRVKINEEGIVEKSEMKKCMEMVMENDEVKMNAKNLKDLAKEAGKQGGSSCLNLKAFVDQI